MPSANGAEDAAAGRAMVRSFSPGKRGKGHARFLAAMGPSTQRAARRAGGGHSIET